MSKAHHLNHKSGFSTTTADFQTKLKSENLNATTTDTAILQSVAIKIEQLDKRQQHVLAKIQNPYLLEQVWQVLTD